MFGENRCQGGSAWLLFRYTPTSGSERGDMYDWRPRLTVKRVLEWVGALPCSDCSPRCGDRRGEDLESDQSFAAPWHTPPRGWFVAGQVEKTLATVTRSKAT